MTKKKILSKEDNQKNLRNRVNEDVEQMAQTILKIQQELMYPALIFKKHNIKNTITIFGSARIKSPEDANCQLDKINEQRKSLTRVGKAFYEKLDYAKRTVDMSKYYLAAEQLSYKFAKWSKQNLSKDEQFYICSGGGPGIMEASNKGATRGKGGSIGLSIKLPDEQAQNTYVDKEISMNFEYFLTRKFWLLYFTKALVIFPGGIGTLDEFFEIYTLAKTNTLKKYLPTVLFGRDFWEPLIDFDVMVKFNTMAKKDLSFFKYSDSVDETFEYLTTQIKKHYLI